MANYAYMNPGKQHLGYRFDSPPSFQRGYDEFNQPLRSVMWNTAVVLNRRAYIGNVKVTDIDGDSVTYPDAIFKSDPNRFDLFREKSKIESAVNDGEEIKALSSFGDMLLEFKNKTLNIINVSNELEYLESTHNYLGTHSSYAVLKIDSGVVWISHNGIYLYNGKEIRNLVEKNGIFRLSSTHWDAIKSSNTAKSALGFDPINRQLIVIPKVGYNSDGASDNNTYVYDFRQDAWIYAPDSLQAANRLAPITYKDKLYIPTESGGYVKLFEWLPVPDSSNNTTVFSLKTKDIDFGNPSIRKRLYKVYITYKTSSNSDATNIQAQYYVNGDTSTAQNFDIVEKGVLDGSIAEVSPPDTANQYSVCILKPNSTAIKNNIYSMQLSLFVDASTTKKYDFQINDISIVYRVKSPR